MVNSEIILMKYKQMYYKPLFFLIHQDYNYDYLNCLELAVHVGCCNYPQAVALQRLWDEHRDALLAMMDQVWK